MIEKTITVTNHKEQRDNDRKFWKSLSPEERLDIVEKLRIEAGKFIYDYPARMKKVITVTNRKNKLSTDRIQDKADVEELK
ncbi:MAG: hypothetical protein PF574_02365 [Candidatus Delongbacteria bacterium]|jgi:hypothetical protein|nr:hypothetical protein [Candidatus Delongbacteria bacterium]